MTDSSTEVRCRICDSVQTQADLPAFMWPIVQRGVPPVCRACAEQVEEDDEDAPPVFDPDRLTARRVARSDLPVPLRSTGLDDLDASGDRHVIVNACRRWASPGGTRGLYLHGRVGTGKTSLAAAALLRMASHRDVRWTSAPALMQRLSADFGSEDREAAMKALLADVPLVLDDLGHERRNETARSALFTAIDDRLVRGIPVLITSNFTPSELGDHYGAWLSSRLVGACDPYVVKGPDRRLIRNPE